MRPDLLLLDEPFSSLDEDTRRMVADDVYKMIKHEKKTTIIVTHDIEEAISMADKVIIMSKRPSKIIDIIDIKYKNRKSPLEIRKTSEFNYYYNLIWEKFNHEV